MEPYIDNMPQTSVSSILTKKWWRNKFNWTLCNPPSHNLSQEIKQSLNKLLETFKSQFAQDETSIGTTHLTKMHIDTGTSESVSQRPYPIAMKHYDWVKNKINKILDIKVICTSHSSWSTSIIIDAKGDGGKCLVIDYRAQNKVIQKFIWPMPKVKDIFSKLNGVLYFSSLNICARYHHVPLNDDLIPKTSFTSPFRKYEYQKVPFGLAQAPVYFQELINKVLMTPSSTAKLQRNIWTTYNFHKHHNAKVFMKLHKCDFFAKENQYFGNVLNTTRIKPLPSKTEVIKLMWPQKNAKQVWAFLGYYQKFIKNFAQITKTLKTLMHHDAKYDWTQDCQVAFINLKDTLIHAHILWYPDPLKWYKFYTDATDNICDIQLHPRITNCISFAHIHGHSIKWSTPKQEAYGVYYAITKWTTISRDLTSSCAKTTNLCRRFSMARTHTTR